MTNPLDGQIAVVTGGSRGIGRSIAQQLAGAGAKVAVTARNRVNLEETVKLITDAGGESVAFVMDVGDPASVKAGMNVIESQFGAIDLLVNNAGIGGEGATPWHVSVDDWWRTLEINVRGVFACCNAVLPGMIERQRGRIVNLSSNAAFGSGGAPIATSYSVSKAALISLTENLAASVQEFAVSVFAISPGLVLTDMTRDVPIFKDLPPSAWVPIEKAGELCVVLGSGDADKLTGRYIHVTDDVHDLIARADEIIEQDLNVLRFRR